MFEFTCGLLVGALFVGWRWMRDIDRRDAFETRRLEREARLRSLQVRPLMDATPSVDAQFDQVVSALKPKHANVTPLDVTSRRLPQQPGPGAAS